MKLFLLFAAVSTKYVTTSFESTGCRDCIQNYTNGMFCYSYQTQIGKCCANNRTECVTYNDITCSPYKNQNPTVLSYCGLQQCGSDIYLKDGFKLRQSNVTVNESFCNFPIYALESASDKQVVFNVNCQNCQAFLVSNNVNLSLTQDLSFLQQMPTYLVIVGQWQKTFSFTLDIAVVSKYTVQASQVSLIPMIVVLVVLITTMAVLLVLGVLIVTGKLSLQKLKQCCVKKVTVGEMTINLQEFNEVKDIIDQSKLRTLEKISNLKKIEAVNYDDSFFGLDEWKQQVNPDTEMDCQLFAQAKGPDFVETMGRLEFYYGDGVKTDQVEPPAPKVVVDVVPQAIISNEESQFLSAEQQTETVQVLGSGLRKQNSRIDESKMPLRSKSHIMTSMKADPVVPEQPLKVEVKVRPTTSEAQAEPIIIVQPKGKEPPRPSSLSHFRSEPAANHLQIQKTQPLEKMQTQSQMVDKVQEQLRMETKGLDSQLTQTMQVMNLDGRLSPDWQRNKSSLKSQKSISKGGVKPQNPAAQTE